MRLIVERFPETARDLWTDEDTVEVQIARGSVVETLRTLRDDSQFGFFMLADAAAVDYGVGNQFEVVYHLYSDKHPAWLRVRVPVERANPRTPSVTGLWTGAMFHEREMYDMMERRELAVNQYNLALNMDAASPLAESARRYIRQPYRP